MEPIRIAVLGTARIARTVVPRIQAADGATVRGIASRSADHARRFADEFDVPCSWGSYQQAIDDPDVDAVYIPLPPSLHAEWTCRAAAAGKHILSEKPLALNTDQVRQMISACDQHQVVLLDGVMWYHAPRATAIHDTVHSGQLGRVRQITSVFTFNWDEFPADNVRMQRQLGGGSLLDLGWYCVGASIWLLQSLPVRVTAQARYHRDVNQQDVDTRFNAMLEFPEGRMATIECGFDTVKRRWIEVAGTRGNLVCDDFTRPWDDNKPRYWTHDQNGQATEHVIPHKPQEEHMVDTFVNLIRSGQVNHAWRDLSLQTQRVCDALDQSARQETRIELS